MPFGSGTRQRTHGIADLLEPRIGPRRRAGKLRKIAGTEHHDEPHLIGLQRPLAARQLGHLGSIDVCRFLIACKRFVAQIHVVGQLHLPRKLKLRGIEKQLTANDELLPIRCFFVQPAFDQIERSLVATRNFILGFLFGAVGRCALLGFGVLPLLLELVAHAGDELHQLKPVHLFSRTKDRFDISGPIDLGPTVNRHETLHNSARVNRLRRQFAKRGEQVFEVRNVLILAQTGQRNASLAVFLLP